MSKLIVICGLPGSGKTVLAETLAQKLGMVLLRKDAIKEDLYDSLGLSTLEDSRRIGKQSMDILFDHTHAHIANEIDVIIEAPFTFTEDFELFRAWINTYNLKFYAIICSIAEEIRKQRFLNRPRHAAHHDSERNYQSQDESIYDTLPDTKIKITTNLPPEQLVKEVILYIQ